jgi:hypothetical protein
MERYLPSRLFCVTGPDELCDQNWAFYASAPIGGENFSAQTFIDLIASQFVPTAPPPPPDETSTTTTTQAGRTPRNNPPQNNPPQNNPPQNNPPPTNPTTTPTTCVKDPKLGLICGP